MIGAIIQARMGSTRLPGKVLMPLNGKPMLLYMIDRVKRSKLIEKIVVATTIDSNDDCIVELCQTNGILYSRGSVDDVAQRYFDAAVEHDIETIVRLTADCPFVYATDIDACIHAFNDQPISYVSNTVPPTHRMCPDGSDVEVFWAATLGMLMVHPYVTDSDREHVTHAFWKNPHTSMLYRGTAQMSTNVDRSKYRYTVDYPEDYVVAQRLAQMIVEQGIAGTTDEICKLIDDNPELFSMNSSHTFGEGWSKGA